MKKNQLTTLLMISLASLSSCNTPTSSLTSGSNNNETDYKLTSASDIVLDENKITVNSTSIIWKEDRIHSSYFDTIDFYINEGNINASETKTKKDLGDSYKMNSGSFYKQTIVYEETIKGKSQSELDKVTNDDLITAGCTMSYTPNAFNNLIKKSNSDIHTVNFKTSQNIVAKLGFNYTFSDGKLTINTAAVALNNTYAVYVNVDTTDIILANITPDTIIKSKKELGDNYKMNSGTFYKQATAYEKLVSGKEIEEIAMLSSEEISTAGCTMSYTPNAFTEAIKHSNRK